MDEQQVKDQIATYLQTELALSNASRLTVKTGELSIPLDGYYADVVVYDGASPMFAVECKGHDDVRKAIGQAMVYRQAGIPAGVAGVDIPTEQQDAIIETELHGFNIVKSQVHELDNFDITPSNQIAKIKILEEKLEKTRSLLD